MNGWKGLTAVSMFALACSGKAGSPPPDVGPADAGSDTVTDVDLGTPEDVSLDSAGDEAGGLPIPWGPENRGWKTLRGVVHVHSVLSHDGCAPDTPGPDSDAGKKCLAELRAGACQAGMDFIFQTDHPGNVADATAELAFHHEPASGDVLFKDAQGRPFANRVTCGPKDPVQRTFFYVGTEGKKQMPIGLAYPVPPEVFSTNYGDSGDLAAAQAAIAKVHELGGFAFAAHTEEDDISAERIQALPLDGMEIYNIHSNLMAALANMDQLMQLDAFLAPGPAPDLGLMVFLAAVPMDGIKFDTVAPNVRLSLIMATDIHQNVELPAICEGGIEGNSICENLAAQYPNFAHALVTGGPLLMSDGERIDGYARSFRWLSNRVLVTDDDPAKIREAVGKGREYGTFDAFGLPEGFDFFVMADGKVIEMGEEVSGAKEVTLHLRTPVLTVPKWGLPGVADCSAAEMTANVIRARKGSSDTLLKLTGQGMTLNFTPDDEGPAVYRVEITVVPRHLKPALKGVEALADLSFPYLYSNAIFVR